MAREIQDETCGRCAGKGVIPHFAHVAGGICFRCWGSGVDPRTLKALQSWLARARQEYATRRARLAEASEPEARKLRQEMKLIEALGKERRGRADRLQANYQYGRQSAVKS